MLAKTIGGLGGSFDVVTPHHDTNDTNQDTSDTKWCVGRHSDPDHLMRNNRRVLIGINTYIELGRRKWISSFSQQSLHSPASHPRWHRRTTFVTHSSPLHSN